MIDEAFWTPSGRDQRLRGVQQANSGQGIGLFYIKLAKLRDHASKVGCYCDVHYPEASNIVVCS